MSWNLQIYVPKHSLSDYRYFLQGQETNITYAGLREEMYFMDSICIKTQLQS